MKRAIDIAFWAVIGAFAALCAVALLSVPVMLVKEARCMDRGYPAGTWECGVVK